MMKGRFSISAHCLGFLLLVVPLLFVSCNKEGVSKAELLEHIADTDHDLTLRKQIHSYDITMSYYPTDLMVQREYNRKGNTKKLDELKSEWKGIWYFNLTLSDDSKEVLNRFARKKETYQKMSNRLTYEMDQFVSFLNAEKDAIPLIGFHTSLTYGMNDRTQVLLSLDASEASKSEWIEVVISEFGLEIGEQRFRFSTRDIKNIPFLKFNIQHNEQT